MPTWILWRPPTLSVYITYQGWCPPVLSYFSYLCCYSWCIMDWVLEGSLQFQYANFNNADYNRSGKGLLRLQLINQREDFSFALFSGGLSAVGFQHISSHILNSFWNWHFSWQFFMLLQPKLIAISNKVSFQNPKAPVYPRLAQGKSWNEVRIILLLIVTMQVDMLITW